MNELELELSSGSVLEVEQCCRIVKGSVALWTWDLDIGIGSLEETESVLSGDEFSKARNFINPRDRHRYSKGRSGLRQILAACIGEDPAALLFDFSARGKPQLASPFSESGLHFNLSHSSGRALLAVSYGGPLGLDLEAVRPLPALEELAAMTFKGREMAWWQQKKGPERLEAFFSMWTAKEALLKGLDLGLAKGLEQATLIPGGELMDADGTHGPWKTAFLGLPFKGFKASLAWSFQPEVPDLTWRQLQPW